MDKKALSLPILIAIVVGNMIGSGIYVLPATLAKFGTISILSWIYTSVGALFLAISFIHLNRRYPKTGGPYAYCRLAFGKPTGFVIACIYWFSNLVSIAALSITAVGYLGFIFPSLDAASSSYSQNLALFTELSVVWLFTAVNIIGLHVAGVVQLYLTIIKIIPLFLIALFGFGYMHFDNLGQFSYGDASYFSAFSSAAAVTFWSFVGLEAATVPAENTSGPKDIYRATIWSTLFCALVYVLCTVVIMGMIPSSALQSSQFPFATAGAMIFGPYGAFIIVLFAFISGISAVNVCILLQGQIVFAAARDNLFPHSFAKLSKRDVPIRAQIFSAVLLTILLTVSMQPTLLKQFNNVALLASFLTLVTYLVSMLAELRFVVSEKKPLKGMLLNKNTILAVVATFYALWMISSIDAFITKIGFILILCFIPVYYLVVKKPGQAA